VSSPFVELFAALAGAFDAIGAGWYLFGAQAALIHGVARFTADVAILAAHPNDLDLDLVRNTLLLLEEALGQSDLLPALEQALARARGQKPANLRGSPPRAKPKRERKPRPR